MRRSFVLLAAAMSLAAAFAAAPARADALFGAGTDTLQLTVVASGMTQATDVRFLPDGRAILTELGGRVRIRAADGTLVEAGAIDAVLPMQNGETGLLALEVHPDFDTTRLLYFYYSRADAKGGTAKNRDRLVSMRLRADDTLDLASEVVLLDGLESSAGQHHGGGLSIGPDGRLYLAVGDTGCLSGRLPDDTSTPANFYSTCLTNGQGKILRLELDGSIPKDNPLVGIADVPACGGTCDAAISSVGAPFLAIWAWGFRNPFRLWVDSKTGLPWVGDVGERGYEEIDVARVGRHHGWPWREGKHGYPVERCADVTGEPCVDPVYECAHTGTAPDGGCIAVTGGAILDDCTWPAALRGRYWFADSGSAILSSLAVNEARDGVVEGSRLDAAIFDGWPVAVRPGPDGDLYVLTHFGRLVRVSPRVRATCGPLEGLTVAPPGQTILVTQVPEAAPVAATADVEASDASLAAAGGGGCQTRGGATSPAPWTIAALAVAWHRRRRRAAR